MMGHPGTTINRSLIRRAPPSEPQTRSYKVARAALVEKYGEQDVVRMLRLLIAAPIFQHTRLRIARADELKACGLARVKSTVMPKSREPQNRYGNLEWLIPTPATHRFLAELTGDDVGRDPRPTVAEDDGPGTNP